MKDWMDRVTGRKPVDLLIRGGHVADVLTGQFRPVSVAIYQGRIAALRDLPARSIMSLKGEFLLPGFIDAHVHIESSLGTPDSFARGVVPAGTTTVIADPHEIANVAGLEGIRGMMAVSRRIPLSVFYMLPSCVPATPFEDAGAHLTAKDLAALMEESDVLGLGEMMDYPAVLSGEAEVMEKILLARRHGKFIDGHAPGLRGADLAAYAAAGISTDHESSDPAEFLEKLSVGQYGLIREGSAARNLKALIGAVTPENSRRILFCTDDRQPEDILTEGHINNNVRLAVEAGLPVMTALQMATLNASEAYGLRDRGALVPGRRADFQIVETLEGPEAFRPRQVFIEGEEAARGGQALFPGLSPEEDLQAFPGHLRNSVRLAPDAAENLSVELPEGPCRIMTLSPRSLVTGERQGRIEEDKEGWFTRGETREGGGEQRIPLAKLVVLERHKATGKGGVAFLEGLGLTGGAVASTIAHDSHNLIAAGTDDDSLKCAVQAVAEAGGGLAAAAEGKLLGVLPLPIGGIMTDEPPGEVDRQLRDLQTTARETLKIGEEYDPFMTLAFLALPVIPRLKLTPRGLFDVETFQFVSLEV